MNTNMFQASRAGPLGRRTIGAFVLGVAISLLASGSAFAEKNDGHGRGDQHANQHNNQGQRGWHDERDHRRYQSNYRRPYNYAQPVYVPPPVYYEPRQSPGISLFFPLDLRR